MKLKWLVSGLSAIVFVASMVACNKSGDITTPSNDESSYTSEAPAPASAPTPAASPTPPTPDKGHPEVIYNGKFVILNPMNHPVTYRMCTYQVTGNGTSLQNQKYLGQTDNVTAQPKTDSTVIPWNINDYKDEAGCGLSFKVQVDPWKGGSDCPKNPYDIDERGTFLDVNTEPCSCDNYEKPGEPNWSGKLELTNQTATTVTVVQGSISPVGVLNPTLPQTVDLPEYGHTAQFQTTNTVILPYGPEDLQCSASYSHLYSINLPPKDRTCGDVNAAVTVDVDGKNATCTATWNDPGSGQIRLDNNTPTSIANGGSKAYNNLSAGTHTCKLTVDDGSLTCQATKSFNIVPGQCDMSIVKSVNKTNVEPGDGLTWRIEIENVGSEKCTGGGVQIFDANKNPTKVEVKRERHSPNGRYIGYSGNVLHWNFDVMTPGEKGWVEWDGLIKNPAGNCDDFRVNNKAKVWSAQRGDQWSNEVGADVDVTCDSCPPSSTTSSVNWTKLIKSTYGVNPKCSDFGLDSLYKKEGGLGKNWSTDRAASIVIVKSGKCSSDGPDFYAKKASPNDPTKWIRAGLDVSFSCDGHKKDLSHVEMCGCPVAGLRAQFDPYAVPDPIW